MKKFCNQKAVNLETSGFCYFITFKPKDKIEAKIDLALRPDWYNPKNKVTLFVIKKDTIINIGKVAPQQVRDSNTILAGGADQIYIRYDELTAGWNSRIIPLEDYPLD